MFSQKIKRFRQFQVAVVATFHQSPPSWSHPSAGNQFSILRMATVFKLCHSRWLVVLELRTADKLSFGQKSVCLYVCVFQLNLVKCILSILDFWTTNKESPIHWKCMDCLLD